METSKEFTEIHQGPKKKRTVIGFKKGYIQLSGDGVFHTVQGEGPFIGHPATFIRLNKCNLRCNFCDTPYTFDDTLDGYYEAYNVKVSDIIELIDDARLEKGVDASVPYNIVITGGEPLLQVRAIEELIEELEDNLLKFTVQIETNGTIYPGDAILSKCDVICSPKLSSSGNKFSKYTELVYKKLAKKCIFKFVCSTEEDIEEVLEFTEIYNVPIKNVYIMPEGVTMQDNHKSFQGIIKLILVYGFKVTPRLQNIIWEGSIRRV